MLPRSALELVGYALPPLELAGTALAGSPPALAAMAAGFAPKRRWAAGLPRALPSSPPGTADGHATVDPAMPLAATTAATTAEGQTTADGLWFHPNADSNMKNQHC